MIPADAPDDLRTFVRARARSHCEYCQTSEELSGIHFQVDHILPRSHQGATTADNLCLACPACNGHKHARTQAADPESGEPVPLFNPRQQRWKEHFAWSADGTEILGLSPTGRATIVALRMNSSLIMGARSLWVSLGAHPPRDESS